MTVHVILPTNSSYYKTRQCVITTHDNSDYHKFATTRRLNLRKVPFFLQFTKVQTSDLTLKLSKTHLKMHKERALSNTLTMLSTY